MYLTLKQLRKIVREGMYSDWMTTAGACAGGLGISAARGGRDSSTQHLGSPEEQEDAIEKEYQDSKLVQPGSLAWEREQEELGEVRKLIRMMIEGCGAPATSPHAMWRNALSPTTADRQQIGKLGDPDHDEDTDNNTEITSHLREPLEGEDLNDLWGPVPPTSDDDSTNPHQDAFVRDSSPFPTSRIGVAS